MTIGGLGHALGRIGLAFFGALGALLALPSVAAADNCSSLGDCFATAAGAGAAAVGAAAAAIGGFMNGGSESRDLPRRAVHRNNEIWHPAPSGWVDRDGNPYVPGTSPIPEDRAVYPRGLYRGPGKGLPLPTFVDARTGRLEGPTLNLDFDLARSTSAQTAGSRF